MRAVFKGNTVFILKGENGKLYGYYPKYNIARLTNVHYVKPDVTPMPNHYKRWFYPGQRFHLYKPEELSSDIEQLRLSINIWGGHKMSAPYITFAADKQRV